VDQLGTQNREAAVVPLCHRSRVEGRWSKTTRHSPVRRVHWRGKVATAGEAGESKKQQFWPQAQKEVSELLFTYFLTSPGAFLQSTPDRCNRQQESRWTMSGAESKLSLPVWTVVASHIPSSSFCFFSNGCKILVYKFIHSLSTFSLSYRHSGGTGVG